MEEPALAAQQAQAKLFNDLLARVGAMEQALSAHRNQMDVDLLFIMVGGGVNGYRRKIWLE
jgi:hypothetical protein